MNVLWFFDNTDDRANAGFKRILVTEENHPYLNAWWPPGHVIGYEHTFTHEIMDFVECIVKDIGASPSFADGLQVQKVLAAVEKSANNDGKYEKVQSLESGVASSSLSELLELPNFLRRLSLSQAIKVDNEIKNSTGIARKDIVTGSPVGVATAEKMNVTKTTKTVSN